MRHEKKLLALPVPPCPPLEQKERERASSYSWRYFIRYAAEVHSVDGDEVLTVTTFTVDGQQVESYQADVDTDANYTPDTEVVENGAFQESKFRSAPYFDLRIDGITLLDEAYG